MKYRTPITARMPSARHAHATPRSRRSSEVMPVRSVRLFVVALLGACLASVALAAGPTLVLRGDVATTRGMMEEVAKAWARSGHGKIDLQPFNTASGLDALRSG